MTKGSTQGEMCMIKLVPFLHKISVSIFQRLMNRQQSERSTLFGGLKEFGGIEVMGSLAMNIKILGTSLNSVSTVSPLHGCWLSPNPLSLQLVLLVMGLIPKAV